WGVYVVIEALSDYAAACFRQYGLPTDATGRYAAMYRPFHMIGLELATSVLSAALRGEATGTPLSFHATVAAVATRDLARGDRLDGEGGYSVWGRVMPAARAARDEVLPIGLAQGITLRRAVAKGTPLRFADVEIAEDEAVRLYRDCLAMA
ncbi:SAF domain-containing protein, partial [Limimaricola soesokkakensis]|uniref:SAF domain-containing protein n=1 Tax=Limimaricola soesokkakensis TaxID=1343159 RepID=UPI00351875CE